LGGYVLREGQTVALFAALTDPAGGPAVRDVRV
jgi:hypothetical protein